MQGVFNYAPLVNVNIRATGYAFPHANLPRFSSPPSRLLMLRCLALRQAMNTANLQPRGDIF
jgi:hypothetical protein